MVSCVSFSRPSCGSHKDYDMGTHWDVHKYDNHDSCYCFAHVAMVAAK